MRCSSATGRSRVRVGISVFALVGTTLGVVTAGQTASLAATSNGVALRVLPFGDSVTYGSHSSQGNGYRGPLWNELTGEGYRLDFVGGVHEGSMADSDNSGYPGWRIDPLQSIANGTVQTYKPNVVLLEAGANDLIQNYNVSTAPSRLSALIDQLNTNDPGATVLVGTTMNSLNSNVIAYRAAFNAALPGIVASKQSAGKHDLLVDMGAVTTADLGPDGIHPTDGGYTKMADAWNKGIQTATSNGWIGAPVSLGNATGESSGEVLSGIAGKCLDVNGASSADGTAVQLWSCNHSGAQVWTVYTDGTLRSQGKCLDANGGATANGTKAQLWTCNGTGAQVWQSANGGYVNLQSGRCLDDPAASTTDGTQLALWDCNGGANQQWAAPGVGPFISGNLGKCMDDNGASTVNGSKVQMWDCNAGSAQQWDLRYNMVQIASLCLDIPGSGTANGLQVEMWDCDGSAGEVWQAGANGSLVNPSSGKCLDDPGFNATNGTQLDIWSCNGGANQNWSMPTT